MAVECPPDCRDLWRCGADLLVDGRDARDGRLGSGHFGFGGGGLGRAGAVPRRDAGGGARQLREAGLMQRLRCWTRWAAVLSAVLSSLATPLSISAAVGDVVDEPG